MDIGCVGPSAYGGGVMRHETVLRVRFSELDPYDHVNHAAYVNYLETGRIEALRHQGLDLSRLRDEGALLVAVELQARFLRPAFGGEELVVRTAVEKVGRASSVWRQAIHRSGEELVAARLTGASVDLGGNPIRLPEALRVALEAMLDA